jgi:hypothetical protein
MSITGFLLVRDSGGVEAGASGGHQEVQGAAAADPAGSPAPDVPPHDVIDRSRSPTIGLLGQIRSIRFRRRYTPCFVFNNSVQICCTFVLHFSD